jgi:hypothetical protein
MISEAKKFNSDLALILTPNVEKIFDNLFNLDIYNKIFTNSCLL